MADQTHGGDLGAAIARYGGDRADWLDLSTGINPVPWPVPAISEVAWTRLPEPGALTALREAARHCYGVHADNHIVVASGAQSLIQTLPLLISPGKVRILGDTYNEYQRQFALYGHKIEVVDRPDKLIGADVAVIANPNNPDGRSLVPDDIFRVVEKTAAVLVDEAFVDVAPELSLVTRALPPNLIVLRSFGKFFGLAGLRLGFAVTAEGPAKALADRLGPWPVSGPAIEIGTRALKDADWISSTRSRLSSDAERMFQILRSAGLEIHGGTDLFVTTADDQAAAWHQRLAEAYIWTRAFDYNPRWLRLGLPGKDADWQRLQEALDVG